MRLDLEDTIDGYRIGWWEESEDICGDLCLGELVDEEDCDHNFITTKLEEILPPDWKISEIFYYETASKAKKALSIARKLWKTYKKDKPWPEWATVAFANGWKPPKNWKP